MIALMDELRASELPGALPTWPILKAERTSLQAGAPGLWLFQRTGNWLLPVRMYWLSQAEIVRIAERLAAELFGWLP